MRTCRRCQEPKPDSEFYDSHPRNCKKCVYERKIELISIHLEEQQRIRPARHKPPTIPDITKMENQAINHAFKNRYHACDNPYISTLISMTDDFLASREQHWQKP